MIQCEALTQPSWCGAAASVLNRSGVYPSHSSPFDIIWR